MRLDVARFSHLIDIIFDVLHLRIDLPQGIKDAAAKGEESKIFFLEKNDEEVKEDLLGRLTTKSEQNISLIY